MDLAGVGVKTAESASVGGSRWGRTLSVGALRQGMRSAEGVRTRAEQSGARRVGVDFVFY
jgi:hypothetical protein